MMGSWDVSADRSHDVSHVGRQSSVSGMMVALSF